MSLILRERVQNFGRDLEHGGLGAVLGDVAHLAHHVPHLPRVSQSVHQQISKPVKSVGQSVRQSVSQSGVVAHLAHHVPHLPIHHVRSISQAVSLQYKNPASVSQSVNKPVNETTSKTVS